MSLGGPNVYPSVLTWLGLARELTAGTPLLPVITHPLEQSQFDPEDTPKFLDDKAIRGSMTDLFYKTLGVASATFSFGGPNFLDSHGYWFDNLFGDLSTTGSGLANPATVSGGIPVGATSCTLAAAPPSSYTAGATIQIAVGSVAEVAVIGSTAASNVVNFAIAAAGEAYPLRFTHATGTTVQTCGTPFCVDEETEILTEDGWKTVHELRAGDIVLTLNHETGMSEWQPALEVCVFPAERREMILMQGRGHSSLSTPDHRWPVISGNGYRVWKTTETLNCHSRIPLAAMCADLPQEAKYADAFVELVAWFWTEGDAPSKRPLRISQSVANAANVARIDAALRGVFGPPADGRYGHSPDPRWRRDVEDGRIVRFSLNAAARDVLTGVAPGRIVQPWFLRSLTQAQLDLFIKVSMLADNSGPTRLHQKDRRAAEAFQFAATLAGYATSLLERVLKPREAVPVTRDGNYSMWGVTLQKRRWFNPIANLRQAQRKGVPGFAVDRTEYDGIVWCPRTANMTWYARRDGQCFFTGNTHRWAALNSALGYGGAYGAQPPTHTLTDNTNLVNTFTSASYGTVVSTGIGARQYPSGVFQEVALKGNAEQLLMITGRGESWISQLATTAPTNITTNSRPVPNWNTTCVVAGVTINSTGLYAGVGEFGFTPTRKAQVYWIVAGTQTPYIIARGPLTCSGTLNFDPSNSEMPLDLMLLNSQPPLSITTTNSGIPNSGTPFSLTFTASQAAITKSKIMRNKDLIGFGDSFEAVSNAVDTGGSGGEGPCTITVINNTATYRLPADDDLPSLRSLHLL